MGMTKQDALARMEKLRSVLERMPDGIEWLCPSLEGFSAIGDNPSILVTADDEFSALAEYFNAQPSQRELTAKANIREWYAMAFKVNGVVLYKMVKRKKEENEHGDNEQGNGVTEAHGDGPDGEAPEESHAEPPLGRGPDGHQADGERNPEQRH